MTFGVGVGFGIGVGSGGVRSGAGLISGVSSFAAVSVFFSNISGAGSGVGGVGSGVRNITCNGGGDGRGGRRRKASEISKLPWRMSDSAKAIIRRKGG